MTEDLKDLIEDIQNATDESLKRITGIMNVEDPIERFKLLELVGDASMAWALPRAKKLTVEEIQGRDDSPSLKTIGQLLGVSPQRVHQLLNPKPRRNPECQTKKSSNL